MGGASCTGALPLTDRDRYAVDDAALTQWFLSRGADPNAQCLLDITPLSAAVQYAPMSVLKLLFEHGGSIAFGQLLNYAAWRELDDRVDVVMFFSPKALRSTIVCIRTDWTVIDSGKHSHLAWLFMM